MKTQIILPEKYYLSHFHEFLALLQRNYRYCFLPQHEKFLSDFESLNTDAQCLFVRMVNRKGPLFLFDDFHYPEIQNPHLAFAQLTERRFMRLANAEDKGFIIQRLSKPQILKLLENSEFTFKKSASAASLKQLLLASEMQLPQEIIGRYFLQEREQEMDYLLFLYFGSLKQNLSLYTMRDLGIRKANTQSDNFKPRFQSQAEALTLYQYAQMWRAYHQEEPIPEFQIWPEPQCSSSLDFRHSLLLALADEARESEEWEKALELFGHAKVVPAREKCARLLYQLGRKEECRHVLDQIMESPWSDEECLFAEDFWARKFEHKRVGVLTETLRSAQKISVDECYFRHPEIGVINHFRQLGKEALHVENHIWNALFGLVFWHEIFESGLLTNPFERIPSVVWQGKFYELYQVSLDQKLEKLAQPEVRSEYFRSLFEKNKDQVNGLFSWYPELEAEINQLLKAPWSSLVTVLVKMCQSFAETNSGFPDLMVIDQGEVSFVEVKAAGDSLKASQLKQMLLLKKAGFKVEILQVDYRITDDQTYVVVDLETTGMVSSFNRITEIGAVKIKGNQIIETFRTLLNPGRSIPLNIQQLTGITPEMVKNAPRFEEVAEKFLEFTKGAIFVAHNVNFDYSFLQLEFQRLEQRFVRPYICTKAGMKKYYPGNASYGLKNLSQQYNIALENHHRALSDAEAAAQLLLLINQKRRENAEA